MTISLYEKEVKKKMPKLLAKTINNAYFDARKRASSLNDSLNSRDGAAVMLGMDRSRLYRIESGVNQPTPEEVLLMADLYNAPELRNYYCRNKCPLGCNHIEAKADGIDRIAVRAFSGFRELEQTKEILCDIAKDGRVSEGELEEIQKVIEIFDEIEGIGKSLKILVEKNQK